MSFEGQRYWDLIRRREYHQVFNHSDRHALVPMIDLRQSTPKYIFVRTNFYHDEVNNGQTFDPTRYYWGIPGVNTNGLVQNPGH
jgi:hypothetical protein